MSQTELAEDDQACAAGVAAGLVLDANDISGVVVVKGHLVGVCDNGSSRNGVAFVFYLSMRALKRQNKSRFFCFEFLK